MRPGFRFKAPEQSDSVIQRANKQVWIFVPINIPTSRQRVSKGLEPRRHFVAQDHLQRQKVKFKGQEKTLSAQSSTLYSETWLGSVETPWLLPVQIITLPVSWKGAPTAKSKSQKTKLRYYITVYQKMCWLPSSYLTLKAIMVQVSSSGKRHTKRWPCWSFKHQTGPRFKPTSCIHVNINCSAYLLLEMKVKRSTHQQVIPPTGKSKLSHRCLTLIHWFDQQKISASLCDELQGAGS